MGLCFSRKAVIKNRTSKRISNHSAAVPAGGGVGGSSKWARIRTSSSRREKFDESVIHERALAAAILFQQQMQQQNGGEVQFDRSTSLRYPAGVNSKRQSSGLGRSSSSRARSLTDPLLQPHQLVNQV